jgi:hypothetical protein
MASVRSTKIGDRMQVCIPDDRHSDMIGTVTAVGETDIGLRMPDGAERWFDHTRLEPVTRAAEG